jgi:hypothetical protein
MPLRLLRIGQARLDRTEQSDYLDLSRGPAVIVKGERSVSRQKLNNTDKLNSGRRVQLFEHLYRLAIFQNLHASDAGHAFIR